MYVNSKWYSVPIDIRLWFNIWQDKSTLQFDFDNMVYFYKLSIVVHGLDSSAS